ncbi:hypothetical protein Patl1_26831 [Pistacia atlantica]|uniref:Uncharacterized protein n=1 Tax=Pistacia atlantica TaxID=434234 RepID=A0ACC1B3X0_9ROSI|nr:hypothetical protein Patl1_26831 [Pistacia atlantica]
MASKPGILTDWPWKPLGNFKYIVLAPWVIHSIYSYTVEDEKRKDLSTLLLFPLILWRFLHNQIWISLSRFRTAKGSNRIVEKSNEFEQVDRETNWDDQILFNGSLIYVFCKIFPGATHMPIWRLDGVILTILLHAGPVEFLYYWLHRALHHHYLYSRYHSHHHSSIVTEPITFSPADILSLKSEISTLANKRFLSLRLYGSCDPSICRAHSISLLFSIPLSTTVFTGTVSVGSIFGYITYIDFMNNMGHCNFELIPEWPFSIFPPLKFLMYTPSESINSSIEKAILEAEKKGAKVLSLGLLNQGQELNMYGELFVQRHSQLKIKVVDGSSLAVAVLLNVIPKETTQVVLRGTLTKVAYVIALTLCQQGMQVVTLPNDEHEKLKKSFGKIQYESNLILSRSYSQKVIKSIYEF